MAEQGERQHVQKVTHRIQTKFHIHSKYYSLKCFFFQNPFISVI